MTDHLYIAHHGIKGQQWGVRNGPPYPLKGDSVSRIERGGGGSISRKRRLKKHTDTTIKTGTVLKTLSYDPNRTKNVEMFYATYTNMDVQQYRSLFNKKAPVPVYDENGNEIGMDKCYKFSIQNKVCKDMKIASEDSGAKAFAKLYESSRDFCNFVTDSNRLEAAFDKTKYKFKGYRESKTALDRLRQEGYKPTEDDLKLIYRMYNYTIPSDGHGNPALGEDVSRQRARFFKELSNAGYSGVLDTNDALYGAFNADAPVIVFDMSSVAYSDSRRLNIADKAFANTAMVGKQLVGVLTRF